MPTVLVTKYYLEMRHRNELKPKRCDAAELRIEQVGVPCPDFNRFLYAAVGWPWTWIDKLPWTFEQWQAYVDRPQLETWVAYWSGSPAGYFELEHQADQHVEIAYFGLLPGYTGRGAGGHLLSVAVERAWQGGAHRVWVNTCTLDHPAALTNYLSRGFHIYQQESFSKEVPAQPQRDWP